MRLISASSKLLIFCVVTISAIGCTKPAPIATTDMEASVRTTCNAEGALNLHVPSPDWRDQVVYMLFIDRFDDGDPTNNDQGYGEHDPQKGTHYSGGDLQGVINRIDYLKSLGATALWISPPVESQWWSTPYQAAGWHGYWATNFKKVDAHFGQLEDYERLSHQLHCNDMYLIQDIVANHTANWFTYDGNYNSNDTAMNFRLLEPELAQTPAAPFNMFNRLDPEHAAANIYHWSPAISDYADTSRRYSSQLGSLADINTENPVVIKELKETYKYWMDEVGVDGFRVDTVAYVPHEFWHQWAHGDDGIYAHANTLGKAHFLTFGEAILLSDPFDDTGEKEIVTFMSQDGKEGLNSMLGFPLYKDIHRVLGEGESSQALAYRLEKFMEIYPDPFTTPNFVDTHDEPRFLATAPVAALKQALAVVFTIPGIPIIYQGTEQALPETRMAMYQGGHRNAAGSFDPQSPMYRYLQALTKIRREHAVLTRGSLDVIAADTAGPGLLAYRR
ncbi:MAG: alpha-amylase family glycosyl hydrolase, partial [Pseudomonadota bacterium]